MVHVDLKITMSRDDSKKRGGGCAFFDLDTVEQFNELELALVRFLQEWKPTETPGKAG